MGKRLFSSRKRPDLIWDPHSLLFGGPHGSLLLVKRQGLQVNLSCPSSAEVKNEWRCTAASPIRLLVLDKKNVQCTNYTESNKHYPHRTDMCVKNTKLKYLFVFLIKNNAVG